jgi:hypothetical protein
MFRAESEPKSTAVPAPTEIASRSETPCSGWLFGPRAVMAMTLCDAPFCSVASGVTETDIELPNSDGPDSGGASWLFMVQAPRSARRPAEYASREMSARFIVS